MNGKGDNPRPLSVSMDFYKSEHERIFGTKKKKFDEKVQALQTDIDKVRDMLDHYSQLPNTESYDSKRIADELTEISQEIGLYDAPKRSEDNSTEFPRIDEDGNTIEWTSC